MPSCSSSLRPSQVTALRGRLSLDLTTAARQLGLTPRQLQHIEEHTKRLSPGVLANIVLILDPPQPANAQTFWQWLADHRSRTWSTPDVGRTRPRALPAAWYKVAIEDAIDAYGVSDD